MLAEMLRYIPVRIVFLRGRRSGTKAGRVAEEELNKEPGSLMDVFSQSPANAGRQVETSGQAEPHYLPNQPGQSSSSPHPQLRSEGKNTRMAAQGRREEKSIVIEKLEGVLPLIRNRFGVAKIGIFGSVARGEDRQESDVDVLVEFAPGQTTFRNFIELAFYLEDLFGRRVDLVTDQGLSRYLRPYVEREVVWCEA